MTQQVPTQITTHITSTSDTSSSSSDFTVVINGDLCRFYVQWCFNYNGVYLVWAWNAPYILSRSQADLMANICETLNAIPPEYAGMSPKEIVEALI